MVWLLEVLFLQFELLEHRVIRSGLQLVLRVADHGSPLTEDQNSVRTLAPIGPPLKRDAISLRELPDLADEFVTSDGPRTPS